MRIRYFVLAIILVLVGAFSCNNDDVSYKIGRPYCRNIMNCVALGQSNAGKADAEQEAEGLCVVNKDGSVSSLLFKFSIATESDSLRNAFNRWVENDLRIECVTMISLENDYVWLHGVKVIGDYAALGECGTDVLSQEIYSAKHEALNKVHQKDLMVDLGDGAVFDLSEMDGRFASVSQNAFKRAADGNSWYFVSPYDNVIRKMVRVGDELVFTDVNHSFFKVSDFILDADDNICAMPFDNRLDDAVLFFNDGSLDTWLEACSEEVDFYAVFSAGHTWYAMYNYSNEYTGTGTGEYETRFAKVWIENKRLKFKILWNGEDGGLSKYCVFPLSDDEFYIIGSSGRLKFNIKTDAVQYEQFPSSFPSSFAQIGWMAGNGWGLIRKDAENSSGAYETIGFDAYNIYTFEHRYISIPGGAGNICGWESDSDIVYLTQGVWNEMEHRYDNWVLKVDVRNESYEKLSGDFSNMLFFR